MSLLTDVLGVNICLTESMSILTVGFVLGILLRFLPKSSQKNFSSILAFVAMLFFLESSMAFGFVFEAPQKTVLYGRLAQFSQSFIVGISLVSAAVFWGSKDRSAFFRTPIVALFFITIVGMLILVTSDHALSCVMSLEILWLGLVFLISHIHPSRMGHEGSLKLFFLGSLGTALLLLGLVLMYTSKGTLHLPSLISGEGDSILPHYWYQLGFVLFLSGLGLKLGLAPLHLCLPDVYESSPTGLVAFLSASLSFVGAVVILRLGQWVSDSTKEWWDVVFGFFAIISILMGSLLGMVQSSVKRMLAYSSILHFGHIALGFCCLESLSTFPYQVILFYVGSYAIFSMLGFGVLASLEQDNVRNIQLSDLEGLHSVRPGLAFLLAFAILSYAGAPVTSGFMARLILYMNALEKGYQALVVLCLLSGLVSFYCHLRVVSRIYVTRSPASAGLLRHDGSKVLSVTLGILFIVSLAFGSFLSGTLLNFFGFLFGDIQLVGR